MDNAIWLKLIDQLPQILTSLGVILVGYWAYRGKKQSEKNEVKIDASDAKQTKAIEVVRTDVNDKMQQFISLTKTSSHAEGVKDELERDKGLDPATLPDVVKVELIEDARTGTQKAANESRKSTRE